MSMTPEKRALVKPNRGAGLRINIRDTGIAECTPPALAGDFYSAVRLVTSASTAIVANIARTILRSLASCSACTRSHSSHLVTVLLPVTPCTS